MDVDGRISRCHWAVTFSCFYPASGKKRNPLDIEQ